MSVNHRAEAERALRQLGAAEAGPYSLTVASEATARALLAIEARLGELVDEQRKANVLTAYAARVIKDDNEYFQARDTVRAVLGLTTIPEGRPQ